MNLGSRPPATGAVLEPVSGGRIQPIAAWQSLVRLISRGPVLACTDQAVVSATSFVTLILVARWTDAEQLGIFAIGVSIIGLTLAVQHALVSLPYAVQRHRPPGSAGEHAFSCLVHSGLFSTSVALFLSVVALYLAIAGADPTSVDTAWALAALMPLAATKEFAREFALARLEWRRALALDLVASAVQLSAILWLGLAGQLSPLTAYSAMGASCGLATLGWFWFSRSDIDIRLSQLTTTLRQNWQLGKWLFLSRSGILVQGYSTYWLSMLLAGAAATGVYAACMSIVAFANPLLLGLYNFLVPNAVLAWKDGGAAGLRRRAAGDALLLGVALGLFFLIVVVAGEEMMRLLYPGKEYAGHGLTLAVLALGTLVGALAIPATNALASMERPRPLAGIAGVSAALNVGLVWWLIGEWGLLGAAFGILAANLVGTLGRWAIFLAATRDASNPAATAPQEQ